MLQGRPVPPLVTLRVTRLSHLQHRKTGRLPICCSPKSDGRKPRACSSRASSVRAQPPMCRRVTRRPVSGGRFAFVPELATPSPFHFRSQIGHPCLHSWSVGYFLYGIRFHHQRCAVGPHLLRPVSDQALFADLPFVLLWPVLPTDSACGGLHL